MNKHQHMNSIYTKADPAVLKLFAQAGNRQKVLCAPLDFAKDSHAVMFCNGAGDVLKKAFHVPNSPAGAERLVAELKATCQHRGIGSKHVLLGGEDLPSYAENFLAELRRRGYAVARVNAWEAKQHREKTQASTDFLDLHGIADCLLKGRARLIAGEEELHEKLRVLVREREFLVGELTALKNRLHPLVDRLFPGFLEGGKSGIAPHGLACRWLLRDRFSAPQIARRNRQALVSGLRKCRVLEPEKRAEELQSYAEKVLPPRPELVVVNQTSVEQLVPVIELVEEAARELHRQIAELLAQSPGARLTTVPGLGITLSAGLAAEIFLLNEVPSLARLCCYAGIIPVTQQSGGPGKPAVHSVTRAHCNLRLKNYLMRAGELMAKRPGTDAARLRKEADQKGQHVERVLAKHAAAVVRALLLHERAYLPAAFYHPQSRAEDRGAYFQSYWPKLRAKWPGLRPERLFDPALPLGRWRKAAQEAYRISLPLPGSDETSGLNQPEEDCGESNDSSALEESAA